MPSMEYKVRNCKSIKIRNHWWEQFPNLTECTKTMHMCCSTYTLTWSNQMKMDTLLFWLRSIFKTELTEYANNIIRMKCVMRLDIISVHSTVPSESTYQYLCASNRNCLRNLNTGTMSAPFLSSASCMVPMFNGLILLFIKSGRRFFLNIELQVHMWLPNQ